jgi:nucleoside phosphorylase
MATRRRLHHEEYTVGWVCALPIELAAAAEMLDETHDHPSSSTNEDNLYTLGRVGEHNVIITCLPHMGTNQAADVAARMDTAFPSIRVRLMVGIGGGVPSRRADIRLGDVVVSKPENQHGGVVQYDSGKRTLSGFQRTGFLNAPPKLLQNAIAQLRAKHIRGDIQFLEHAAKLAQLATFSREDAGPDVLFDPEYAHNGGETCETCDADRVLKRIQRRTNNPVVHYGTIASGNQVIRSALERDRVSNDLGGVLCFEMEAGGLMNHFPCLVIRGICDYSDSHKNKGWQGYAAGTAAAYAKELLSLIPSVPVLTTRTVLEMDG